MPKIGMEPLRRRALMNATIDEIGRVGSLDVTVSQIAKRAGMSSALAHHYFGSKEHIFIAAMRHILRLYGQQIRQALAGCQTPRQRIEAIIGTSFASEHFSRQTISAWTSFYVQAQTSEPTRRLLRIYQRRLHANLLHDLRPLVGARADNVAHSIAALIDGVYIRYALGQDNPNGQSASELVSGYLDLVLSAPVPSTDTTQPGNFR